MEYHYKAFISYRHAELDTKVAIEIQNRIERYIIPGSIRRELGIKSIGRVFRDKDELPSTSDLNDNIKNAIINSEYLICICSPRYIESIWCQKEIEFFLESHDKHHILTVLAEGDPYEVVPEILCKETVTVKDGNGNDVTIETKLEPLSCDYRGDRHRARNEEFPRLAAVLIGCRYADLRQKMRKRRMRLAAAAGAFAAALAGYFIWSYINIQNNYRRSLINQSQYLASSANEALSTNDNILAAQLSLAALPDKGKERPVVPEAVYTLSRAIGAYQTKQVMNIRGVASYTPQAGTFSSFAITDDAHYMAMLSTGGDVEVCDLSKNTAPYTLSSYKLFGTAAGKVTDCGVDRFVLYDKNHDDIAMIRFSDGEVLWHQQFKGKDRGVLPLGKDGASLLLLTYDEAIILNSENGEVVSRCSIPAASGGENRSLSVISDSYYKGRTDVCVNEENKSCTILCSSYNKSSAGSVSGALTYYYETGETVWTPFGLENYYFEGVSQDADGNILFSYAEKETDYSLNSYYRRAYDSGSAHFDSGRTAMAMVKEGTGELLWKNTLEYQGLRAAGCFEIRTLPGSDGNPARKVVLAAISNRIALFDAGDGTKIKDISVSDYVVSVDRQDPNESFARVNGASGAQYYFDSSSEGYEGMTFMEGTVDNAYFFHARETFDSVSQYVMRQGNTIRVFKFEQGDDEYNFFGFDVPEGSVIQNYIIGSRLVLRTSDNKLLIYDMENDKKLHEIQLEDDFYYSYLCSAADQSCFYLKSSEDSSGRIILRIDLEKGTCEKEDITHNDFLTGDGKWKFDCSNCIVSGDYLFYRVSNYNSMTSYWFRHSLKDGTTAILELPYYEDIDSSSFAAPRCLFARDGSKCVLYFDNALYLADFVSGTVTAIDAEIPGITYSTRRESDGMFAFYYQGSQESDSRKELHVYDAAGKPVWEINNLPEAITALRFYRDVLIVGTDNNRLYAYDARSGARKGMTELGGKLYHEDLQIYDGTDGDLIFDSGAGSVIMVNYENWAQTGAISDIIGYCPDLKWIISSIDYADKYGYCRYYSVDDLVEKGKAFVGEQTMSEADMAAYGLN